MDNICNPHIFILVMLKINLRLKYLIHGLKPAQPLGGRGRSLALATVFVHNGFLACSPTLLLEAGIHSFAHIFFLYLTVNTITLV